MKYKTTYCAAGVDSGLVEAWGTEAFLFCCIIVLRAMPAKLRIESSSLALVMQIMRPLKPILQKIYLIHNI